MRTTLISIFCVCFILILCAAAASFAQGNYQKATIISLSGDSIKGFVDYRGWVSNPKSISFREENGAERKYNPLQIYGFIVLKEHYKGAIVKTETSPVISIDLSYDSELHFSSDTTFLTVIVEGDKNLYHFHSPFNKDLFYIDSDSGPELLVYRAYFRDLDTKKTVVENKYYLGQLAVYLNKCENIQSQFKSATYTRRGLLRLFSSYYTCTNTKPTSEKKKEKIGIQPGIILGSARTSLTFTGNNPLTHTDFSKPTAMTFGISLEILPPRLLGRWTIYNEILMTSSTSSGTYLQLSDPTFDDTYYSKIGLRYFKMFNMVRYRLPVGKSWIFVNGGLSNGLGSLTINDQQKTTYFYGPGIHQVRSGTAVTEFKPYEFGFAGGAGFRTHNLTAQIRFESGNGISNAESLVSKSQRMYMLLGFSF